MFKAALVFLFVSTTPAIASETPLHELETRCWAEAVDHGSFLCQYLMLLGKMEGQAGWVVPELAAGSEEYNWNQAHFACQRLGFSYSKGFELAKAEKDTLFARFEGENAFAWTAQGPYIQHLLCE